MVFLASGGTSYQSQTNLTCSQPQTTGMHGARMQPLLSPASADVFFPQRDHLPSSFLPWLAQQAQSSAPCLLPLGLCLSCISGMRRAPPLRVSHSSWLLPIPQLSLQDSASLDCWFLDGEQCPCQNPSVSWQTLRSSSRSCCPPPVASLAPALEFLLTPAQWVCSQYALHPGSGTFPGLPLSRCPALLHSNGPPTREI